MDELLHKAEGETDPRYGCSPDERPIKEHISKGVINLDKPSGPTSHEVDSWVKKILSADKTGHGGTLDPVLPVFSRWELIRPLELFNSCLRLLKNMYVS